MFLEDNKCLKRWLSFDHYTLYTCQKYHHIPWICMNFMSQLKIKERRLGRKLLFSVAQVRNRRDTGQEESLCACCLYLIPHPLVFCKTCFAVCLIPLSHLPKWYVWSRYLQGQLLSPCMCVELVSRWLVIKHSMELHVYSISSLKNYKNYRINVCVSVACPLNFYAGQRWHLR